jgi:hypothetical protein
MMLGVDQAGVLVTKAKDAFLGWDGVYHEREFE